MAVDYDGSKTAFDSSANYNAQRVRKRCHLTIKLVSTTRTSAPTIIQESGRFFPLPRDFGYELQDEIEPSSRTSPPSRSTTTIRGSDGTSSLANRSRSRIIANTITTPWNSAKSCSIIQSGAYSLEDRPR